MKRLTTIILSLAAILIAVTAIAGQWGWTGSKKVTLADHLMHPQKGMSYGEQWSGTVVFGNDNHRLNFSLSHSALTTKSDKARFSVEYQNGDERIHDSERCTIKSKKGKGVVQLQCGPGAIQIKGDKYVMQYKGKQLKVLANLTPLVKSFKPGTGKLTAPDDASDFYNFLLMVPRAKATVKINDKVLAGHAVMDHSYSNVNPHEISRHWIRNTVITDKLSVVFGANLIPDGRTTGWISVSDNDGNSYSSHKVDFKFSDFWQDPNKKGYFAPESIDVTSRDGGKTFALSAKKMKLVYKRDMLASLSKLEAFVARRFSDPMEYIFVGDGSITWTVGGAAKTDVAGLAVQIKQMND